MTCSEDEQQDEVEEQYEHFKKVIQVLRSYAGKRKLRHFSMLEVEEIMRVEDTPGKLLRSLEWFHILLERIYGRDVA